MISERWSRYTFSAPIGWKGRRTTSGNFGATGTGASFASSIDGDGTLAGVERTGDTAGARGNELAGAVGVSVDCRVAKNLRGIIGAFFTAFRGPVGALISGLILGPVGIGFSSGTSSLGGGTGGNGVVSLGRVGGGGNPASARIAAAASGAGAVAGVMSLNRDLFRGPVGRLFSSRTLV